MKVFLTLLVLVFAINAYVYHRERAVELTVDADGNGFYCFVQTSGKAWNNGTAVIRKYLFPPKSGASPFIKYEDVVVPGLTAVKGCTLTTINHNGQMYLLGTFEILPAAFHMMHVPYTIDNTTQVPVFGTFNIWLQYEPPGQYNFNGIYNMPQLLTLQNSIFLIFMGSERAVSDNRVCYLYFSDMNAWFSQTPKMQNTSAQYIPPWSDSPGNVFRTYKQGNQDYFMAYVQNGVIKISIAQNRYPFGTCAVTSCYTGIVFNEINSSGLISNSSFKSLSGFNLGAESARPMPGETYHPSSTDASGGVFSNFMSYDSYIFSYSCTWNSTENKCYWASTVSILTTTASVLANDATIFNDNWYIIFIDNGYFLKLYTAPTYWSGSTNYYSPKTLLQGNMTNMNSTVLISPDYSNVERSELSFFQYASSVGTKIYITFINQTFDADIFAFIY